MVLLFSLSLYPLICLLFFFFFKFLNVTGLALGMGVATATDTLCSQVMGEGGKVLKCSDILMMLFLRLMAIRTTREWVLSCSEVSSCVRYIVNVLISETLTGILIISLLLFPIWVAWLNTESLLLLVQQEPCIAK